MSYDDTEPAHGDKSSFDRENSIAKDPEKANDGDPLPQYDEHRRSSKYDSGDPFGDESDSAVKYRTLSWWQASIVMIAGTISLGIPSLPSVLAGIGLVPGIILIVALGVMATYTGYVM
ncbi:hypothetical protein CLAFUW4_07016 [Fulvia fulva]|uniref:Uncharacterized protein n=1 Tax=Passalora fulva TaxID=5499 RepID=A0A9Q8PB48_PASFU|nr:uncharacterized protein CLAFUR5_07152 [Fulvia fulva]KAK4621524.1 hypothetical protein CLAFUR4_07025 [Fulvia fulva]KAK4622568.1 hypothetical protein CLAFUR0_07023 [Fulvia fulva]UJO19234.1 hypothetical protein CLAFUR5_07152 [Fulvia fulva]WPV16765.1 hypothetical protein CLAFUW4_07016 [Fulvia fulva]WPV31278.1 hypothetical protein CLAFUW7_07016 [Fulvia fulva]